MSNAKDGWQLEEAVELLAARTNSFSEVDLGQPWVWGPHGEGVRFGYFGSYQELQDLAVRLRAERLKAGPAFTQAQTILAQKNQVYRDLRAIFLGVDDEAYEQAPAPGEWPLRDVLGHVVSAERTFFSLVSYGVRRQRSSESLPPAFPEGESDRIVGSSETFGVLQESGSLAELLAYFQALHRRALLEFADISDAELAGPSLWWEQKMFPVRHRLHRFAAHAIQHQAQAQKTLDAIGRPATEAQRLIRQMLGALAEVEAVLIGAPQVGLEARNTLAAAIEIRAEELVGAVEQAGAM